LLRRLVLKARYTAEQTTARVLLTPPKRYNKILRFKHRPFGGNWWLLIKGLLLKRWILFYGSGSELNSCCCCDPLPTLAMFAVCYIAKLKTCLHGTRKI
jgi:hypothetical protein